jgi:stage III sporulation protein AG
VGELWNRLHERQKKVLSWLAVVLIVGVGILVLQPSGPVEVPLTPSSEKREETRISNSTKGILEKELTSVLDSMMGRKCTTVFVTMERGPSLKIAYDVTEEERYGDQGLSEKRWTSSPVLMRNDADRKEVPLVLEEIESKVRGVLVVVDWDPSIDLRLAISQAVSTSLQVPMYRIEVLFKQ